jgi:hypothetical protein
MRGPRSRALGEFYQAARLDARTPDLGVGKLLAHSTITTLIRSFTLAKQFPVINAPSIAWSGTGVR